MVAARYPAESRGIPLKSVAYPPTVVDTTCGLGRATKSVAWGAWGCMAILLDLSSPTVRPELVEGC